MTIKQTMLVFRMIEEMYEHHYSSILPLLIGDFQWNLHTKIILRNAHKNKKDLLINLVDFSRH